MNRYINLLNDENSVVRKKTILQIYEKINEEKLNIIGSKIHPKPLLYIFCDFY